MRLEEIREGVVYINGATYFGMTEEIKLPEIQFRTTERKPTGGLGSLELPAGIDKMEAEITWKSYDRQLAATAFNPRRATVMQVRSVKRTFDAGGGVEREVSVVTHLTVLPKSVGLGSHKGGEAAELSSKFAVHAVKQVVDGETLVEIDVINQVFKMGGEDLLSTLRQILGV
ncbi:phage major tail tube protein [Chromobacterium violaceum]|uniref:phage major tail tube protein n=1 Tax=Chromobacterium violaceum TaxID=536 RepID=UPI00194F7721|nr:phage major tail tube protein [Chromobacterium violaceum]QRO34126.1 phage major tail tube protein [Chromobacterium violaceum]QRQ16071.1 phage major tail tube protein [Chromobacterium violaceum]